MIGWIQDLIQARRERKIIEQMINDHLAESGDNALCRVCDDHCEQCVCGFQDCD